MVEMVDSFSEKVGITKDQLSYHHSREEIIVNVKEESAGISNSTLDAR